MLCWRLGCRLKKNLVLLHPPRGLGLPHDVMGHPQGVSHSSYYQRARLNFVCLFVAVAESEYLAMKVEGEREAHTSERRG